MDLCSQLIHTDVDEQFINNGFKSITDILNQVPAPSTPESLLLRADRAGEVLRVLSHVSEPLREEEVTLDLDIPTQELLASTMLESLQLADVMFTKATDSERSLPILTQTVVFLARLLQFDLGFSVVWTTQFRETCEKIAQVLFNLVMVREEHSFIWALCHNVISDSRMWPRARRRCICTSSRHVLLSHRRYATMCHVGASSFTRHFHRSFPQLQVFNT